MFTDVKKKHKKSLMIKLMQACMKLISDGSLPYLA
jgi:hypothetical protein